MYTDIKLELFIALCIEVMFCCVVTSTLRMKAARLSETLVYTVNLHDVTTQKGHNLNKSTELYNAYMT